MFGMYENEKIVDSVRFETIGLSSVKMGTELSIVSYGEKSDSAYLCIDGIGSISDTNDCAIIDGPDGGKMLRFCKGVVAGVSVPGRGTSVRFGVKKILDQSKVDEITRLIDGFRSEFGRHVISSNEEMWIA